MASDCRGVREEAGERTGGGERKMHKNIVTAEEAEQPVTASSEQGIAGNKNGTLFSLGRVCESALRSARRTNAPKLLAFLSLGSLSPRSARSERSAFHSVGASARFRAPRRPERSRAEQTRE